MKRYGIFILIQINVKNTHNSAWVSSGKRAFFLLLSTFTIKNGEAKIIWYFFRETFMRRSEKVFREQKHANYW